MFRSLAASALLFAVSVHAHGACAPVRFAYPDQDRPPYWLGNGSEVANPPGASVELVREFTGSVGCPVALLRLPVMRLRTALQAGVADFTPADDSSIGTPGVAFPLDANGEVDAKRAVPLVMVAFVRASDRIDPAADPASHFRGRTVGTTLGASYAVRMKQLGINIDSGGYGVVSNLEKLRLKRIDGFVVSLITETDMDRFVAERYRGQFVRLEKPLIRTNIWLAASKAYYDSHTAQVEAMWNWLGSTGNKRFTALLKKYSDLP
jgi:hypothetical protein